jgi:hypothetical protein
MDSGIRPTDRVANPPTPTGLCYSCRHLQENDHCRGKGDMPADGFFLGLRCTCNCRREP